MIGRKLFITKYCGFQFPSRFNLDKSRRSQPQITARYFPLVILEGESSFENIEILENIGTIKPKREALAESELVILA
jgi:hypothetical protein